MDGEEEEEEREIETDDPETQMSSYQNPILFTNADPGRRRVAGWMAQPGEKREDAVLLLFLLNGLQ